MKKKILSEAQVKRFMGLAGIQPLNEMSTYMEEEKDEGRTSSTDENLYKEEEDALEPPMPEDDEGAMEDDVDAQIDEDVLMDAVESSRKATEALEQIASSAGLNVGEMGEPEMDVADEPEMPPMPEEDEEDMKDEEDEMDDVLKEVDMELSEAEKEEQMEEIVNEVARRVAKRIVEAKRAHKKMNEALGRKK